MTKPTRHDIDDWFAELIADLNAIYNDYHETPRTHALADKQGHAKAGELSGLGACVWTHGRASNRTSNQSGLDQYGEPDPPRK